MGERKLHILAKQYGVMRPEVLIREQARETRHVFVREKVRGLLGQEPSRHQHVELLASIEFEHVADTVQHLAAHTSVSGFETAERAPVDFSKLSGLLLG
jgi:hypothetical protein